MEWGLLSYNVVTDSATHGMCMSALLTTTNSFLDGSLFVLHQGSHPLEMTTALLVASLHHV